MLISSSGYVQIIKLLRDDENIWIENNRQKTKIISLSFYKMNGKVLGRN